MSTSSDPICFLNGEFVPLAGASISVLDRGFIFGDGVYEVIPVFNGNAFRLSQHLSRLGESLAAVLIENPYSSARMQAICEHLVAVNGGGDQTLYVQLTRGVAPRYHVLKQDVEPTVFAMSSPLPVVDSPTAVAVVTTDDFRWQRCDIKSTSLLANVLAREQAMRAGAEEAIFVRDGWVTEGAASNVFIVVDGVVMTPPLGPHILPGVTRNLLVELLSDSELTLLQQPISREALLKADEAWITSSSRELVPVDQIDGQRIGSGDIGPVYKGVRDLYNAYKASL